MITVRFYVLESEFIGFELSGHSGYAEEGSDIVCAAVTSCAYMTANTVTDIIGVKADIEVSDGFMSLTVSLADAPRVKDIFNGFRLHINALAGDYSEYIACKTENIEK